MVKTAFVKFRIYSHPWRGENNNEHSYYVGHDAGGLSEPLDMLVVDPSCTFLQLRESIEERCDGNVMLRRMFFTEFIYLMQRCHNFHGYESNALKTYRFGVLNATDAAEKIKLIKQQDETKPIQDIVADIHDTHIVLIPTTQIHPTTDRITDQP